MSAIDIDVLSQSHHIRGYAGSANYDLTSLVPISHTVEGYATNEVDPMYSGVGASTAEAGNYRVFVSAGPYTGEAAAESTYRFTAVSSRLSLQLYVKGFHDFGGAKVKVTLTDVTADELLYSQYFLLKSGNAAISDVEFPPSYPEYRIPLPLETASYFKIKPESIFELTLYAFTDVAVPDPTNAELIVTLGDGDVPIAPQDLKVT